MKRLAVLQRKIATAIILIAITISGLQAVYGQDNDNLSYDVIEENVQSRQSLSYESQVLTTYFEADDTTNTRHKNIIQVYDNVILRLREIYNARAQMPAQFNRLAQQLTNFKGTQGLIQLFTALFGSMIIGIILERLCFRLMRRHRDRIKVLNDELCPLAKNTENDTTEDTTNPAPENGDYQLFSEQEIQYHDRDRSRLLQKLKAAGLLFITDFLRLMIFIFGASLIPFFIPADAGLMRNLLLAILSELGTFLLLIIFFRAVIQPNCPGLRLMPLEDDEAKVLFKFLLVVFLIDKFLINGMLYLNQWGIDFKFLFIPMSFITAGMNIFAFFTVWRAKSIMQKVMVTKVENGQRVRAPTMAMIFPMFFVIGVILIWLHWTYYALMGDFARANMILAPWWLLIFFPLLDRGFFIIINTIISIYRGDSIAVKKRLLRMTVNLQKIFKYFLLLVIISLYIQAVSGPDSMSRFTELLENFVTDIAIILFTTYIFWEIINGYIEHRIPEDQDALSSLDGEGGGAGATRSETIIPLIRSFLSAILLIFVTLSILSVLGVEIGPLLAGAGIVGIALGFGAQKLVQDFLSGIFFLIDDAFRKSEYIEIEELRGTVEKISMRSIQLRHHLGAVQTIPYGEIRTVKNLSRDWITMKLEFRLPYGTNVERVRKIIKKVGQEMLEDEEIGHHFILPLKSQGVMRIEESALIFRMKFTTIPGEQWVARREAYRRVQDALAANGIHFAHREVFVRLPGEHENAPMSEEDKAQLSKAGAAAATSILAHEAAQHGRIDEDKDQDQ